jgi:hypothetical protein
VIDSAFGGITLTRFFEQAGAAARGVYVTFGGRPVERLTPARRAFAHRFGASRPGRVANWAVYGAAAAEVLLDAIARSDGALAGGGRVVTVIEPPERLVGVAPGR